MHHPPCYNPAYMAQHAYTVRRKVHAQGGSLLVSLPRLWADANGLGGGSSVDISFNGIVRIRPAKPAPAAEEAPP